MYIEISKVPGASIFQYSQAGSHGIFRRENRTFRFRDAPSSLLAVVCESCGPVNANEDKKGTYLQAKNVWKPPSVKLAPY